MTFRFIGTECQIGDLPKLDRFGQSIDLDPGLAADAIRGGAAILPEGEFDFSAQECASYAMPASHSEVPQGIKDRLLAHRVKLHDLRAALRSGATIEEVIGHGE
jgi:hypothetical protein